MAERKIIQNGDEIMRKVSKPVARFDKALWEILDDMHDTLNKADGVGLAGVQVGILKRIVVLHVNGLTLELINPQIIETSGHQCQKEGCLSIKGVYDYVERPAKVKVRALDRYGYTYEMTGEDLLARAFCHEIDHLDGILFIDKVVKKKGK